MPRCVVYTGWDGCGTTSAFSFFNELGVSLGWKCSQWMTAPHKIMANAMEDGYNLPALWGIIKGYVVNTDFGAFTGWPYSLFYKYWYSDFDSVFVHATRSVETWAYNEFGYHTVRTVPSEDYQNHVDYIYGERLNKDSALETWQTWIDTYKGHNSEVLDYFSDKSNRFININVDTDTDEEIGSSICELMGIDYGGQSFPVSPEVNPASWNNVTIQERISGDTYQELWNSRKDNLNF